MQLETAQETELLELFKTSIIHRNNTEHDRKKIATESYVHTSMIKAMISVCDILLEDEDRDAFFKRVLTLEKTLKTTTEEPEPEPEKGPSL